MSKDRLSSMTKKSIQETNYTSNKVRRGKIVSRKKCMSTVRCLCGYEILVLPDLTAMNRAIKNHVAEHKQAHNCSERLDLLAEFLTNQVLIVASEINLPNVN